MLQQDISYTQTSKKSYNYLLYIATTYSFFFMLPDLILKKMVAVPIFGTIPIDVFFTGTYFVLLDIVTEVYGYREARKLLYAGLLSYTFFIFIMEFILYVPSPKNLVHHINVYSYLFTDIFWVWISVMVCALTANNINIIILAKWKVLAKGRYFWFRSVTTSLGAAIIYSFVSNIFAVGMLLHPTHLTFVLKIMFLSLLAKLITLAICAYPASYLCSYLKKKEGVDVYDLNISYRPFS